MKQIRLGLDIGGTKIAVGLVAFGGWETGGSDKGFRVLCRRHGAGLVCSEMVSAVGVTKLTPFSSSES